MEKEIIDSIFARQAKRADIYWFVSVVVTDEPFTTAFRVTEVADDKVIRIEFRLGFRVQPRINFLLRKVVEEMLQKQELVLAASSRLVHEPDDFRFIVRQDFLSYENDLQTREELLLNSYFSLKNFAESDVEAYGLDASDTCVEKVPLVITPVSNLRLERF